jgi:hypothetical protein
MNPGPLNWNRLDAGRLRSISKECCQFHPLVYGDPHQVEGKSLMYSANILTTWLLNLLGKVLVIQLTKS